MSVVYYGERFAGYRLVGLIGRTVHRALTPEGDTVALRILDTHPDEPARQRFLRETAIARDLRTPHAVPIHEAGESDGRLFVAMRLVPGSDLGELLAGGQRLDPDRVVALLTDVAAALDAAHEAGLVHRGVKPASILVETADGVEHALLTDFGVDAGAGGATGAADYLAPEQLDGSGVDARTDVYALGCVLHRCLAGPAPSVTPAFPARLHHLPAPLSSVDRHRFSAGLDEVVARALATRKEARHPSAGAFLAAVRRALADPGYHDPAAAALYHQPASARSAGWWSPVAAAALAAAAAVIVSALAFAMHSGGTPASVNPASATALVPPGPIGLLAPAAPSLGPQPSTAPQPVTTAAAGPATMPPAPTTGTTPAAPPAPLQTVAPQPPTVPVSAPLSAAIFYATVRNTGQTVLTAGAATLSSTAWATIVDDGCVGVHLAPGASCLVTVRLEPSTQSGATTVLTVPLSDGQPVTFTVSG